MRPHGGRPAGGLGLGGAAGVLFSHNRGLLTAATNAAYFQARPRVRTPGLEFARCAPSYAFARRNPIPPAPFRPRRLPS